MESRRGLNSATTVTARGRFSVQKPRTRATSPIVLQRLGLALASASLLVLCFPTFNQSWCAWIALVPWLLLLRDVTTRAAFWWSYLVGALFFLGSIWWLVHVTVFGWIALCAYLALYFAAFGWFVHSIAQGSRLKAQGKSVSLQPQASSLQRLLIVPAAWVVLEYARSYFLSGFGWNLLAYSQTSWLPVIQIADMTGAWGVSFFIVFANMALASAALPIIRHSTFDIRNFQPAPLLLAMSVAFLVVGYGLWRLHDLPHGPLARIAVVQGNIPQEEKWEETFKEQILTRYETLSRTAAQTQPDLIVWPETSVPGYFDGEEDVTQRVLTLARSLQRSLLVGAPMARFRDQAVVLYNSAVLVGAAGDMVGRYDKLHLVPFGEFIPGERAFPWVRSMLPPIGEFLPGREATVFRSPVAGSELQVMSSVPEPGTRNPELRFSTLICFEDVFPNLARQFVRRGARLLAVITNDAWFGPSAAAYQHAQTSTFRAVELRVPVIRAANTGWSGCIDRVGAWQASVHDSTGTELFVTGTHTCDVAMGAPAGLYFHWGDWFVGCCLVIVASGVLRFTRVPRAEENMTLSEKTARG